MTLPGAQRRRRAARLAEPAHARQLRRHRVRHAEPRSLRRRAGHALHPPRHRLAAVHAGPPRHPVRRARLPVAAVGLDRAVGAADHRRPPRPRRHHDARHRPPAPVRDRRRELPHRLRRVGLRARPRGRPVADVARPVVDGRAGAAAADGRLVAAPPFGRPGAAPRARLRPVADLLPRGDRLSRVRAR